MSHYGFSAAGPPPEPEFGPTPGLWVILARGPEPPGREPLVLYWNGHAWGRDRSAAWPFTDPEEGEAVCASLAVPAGCRRAEVVSH